ncbi:hypothetical protein TNCV_2474251 [Trichonephila clavipes]|nr:hypothetical protein TNCV_2474251 [Trichonephila clavipes]
MLYDYETTLCKGTVIYLNKSCYSKSCVVGSWREVYLSCRTESTNFDTIDEAAGVQKKDYRLRNLGPGLRERNAMECRSELVEVLGNNALPYRTVARWIGKFQQGRVSTSEEQRSG